MKPRILSDLNFRKAHEHLGNLSDDVAKNELFYTGDHWQDGDVLARLQRAFVSKNIVKEIVDRVVTAVLGRDPDWAFARRADVSESMTPRSSAVLPFKPKPPSRFPAPAAPGDQPPADTEEAPQPQPDSLVDEANKIMMDWWKSPDKQLLKQLQAVLRKRLWGERGYLRLWVPFAYLEDDGQPMKLKIEEWVKHLYPDVPKIQDAALLEDLATMARVGLVRIPTGGDKEEYHIELSYLDDDDKTVVVILTEGNEEESAADAVDETEDPGEKLDDEISRTTPLRLMGHLPLYELKGDVLVTPQVRQSNKLVNMAMTMMGHNAVEAGFSELILTNVEMEKVKVPDQYAEGGFKEVPKSLRRGATVVHNLMGVQSEGDDGKVAYETPGVHYHEPSEVNMFTDTKREGYVSALEETHQMHALLSGDAAPSGESRIQALTDFASDCHQYKVDCDALGAWVLETALAWLAELAGTPGKFEDLRATFATRIYVGKLSADERTAIIGQYKDGLLSRTSAMVLLEVDDPDAEVEKIFADKQRQAMLDAATQPPNEGVPPRTVAPGGPRVSSAAPGAPAAVRGKGGKVIPLDAGSEAAWHSNFSTG